MSHTLTLTTPALSRRMATRKTKHMLYVPTTAVLKRAFLCANRADATIRVMPCNTPKERGIQARAYREMFDTLTFMRNFKRAIGTSGGITLTNIEWDKSRPSDTHEAFTNALAAESAISAMLTHLDLTGDPIAARMLLGARRTIANVCDVLV